jgi:raffinose/stachyose/melibiose transport system permease protein
VTTLNRVPVGNARASGGGRRRWHGASINLFYVPAVAILGVFLLYPLISGIQLSFTDWNGFSPARDFIGFENYARLWADGNFRVALLNTAIYGIGSTVLQQVIGLLLALALDRPSRTRKFVRAIVYLPVLISPVIMGMMYTLVFQYNNGVLNDIVVALGGERVAWLSESTAAVAIIVVVNSLQFVGISMIIYLAGLQGIPAEYYEASGIDGAGPMRQFWSITVPMLQPAFLTSVVLNLIGGLKLFDIIMVLTKGGPGYSSNSVSTLISITYFNEQSAGYAAAMGVVLFILIGAVSLVTTWLIGRRRIDA